jgi:TPR repeat protein
VHVAGSEEGACRQAVSSLSWSAAHQSCTAAARGGSVYGKRALGDLFQHGSGVLRSDDSAAFWYQQAALAGDAASMTQLGAAYEHGRGVRKDQGQAAQWYTRAATSGDAAAQYTLGKAFEKGHLGLTRDRGRALEWYRKAAAQSYRDAADRARNVGP